ncbi:MAG: hypothetical protein ABGX15_16235, partial [Paracoccaceae bacterium]
GRARLELSLYSTTGGQTMAVPVSEPTVAQPLSKLVAIARAASRSLQHPALDIIGLLRSLKAFGEAARAFAGPPKRNQEQDHGEGAHEPAQELRQGVAALEARDEEVRADANMGEGLPTHRLDGLGSEQFGFHDALSNPGLRGYFADGETPLQPRTHPLEPDYGLPGQDLVFPGEFVLL